MLFPFFTVFALWLPATYLLTPLVAVAEGPDAPGHMVILQSTGDQGVVVATACGNRDKAAGGTTRGLVCASASGPPGMSPSARAAGGVVCLASDEEDLPKVWIGVRVTPVPAPLAAHIGESGVMVSNLVKGGPADQAGLDRYDVVVTCDGQDIQGPSDLTAAVAKTKAGQALKLGIVRKGARQEIEIKPAERPADRNWELKYEEPGDALVDSVVKMRGHALELGPHGYWIMKDLGPLHGLPEALKELEKLDVKIDLDALTDPDLLGRDIDIKILRKLDEGLESKADEDREVRVEVKVQVKDDGSTTTIQRDADGKIHVTRVDAEGKESSATYDSLEAFEEADPEGYELYRGNVGDRTPTCIRIRPSWDRVRELRKEYQIDVEKKLKEAMERVGKARERASEQYQEALEKAREAIGKARVEVRAKRGAEAGVETQTLVAVVRPDGTVKVTETRDGKKVTHEFKSKEELKTQEPELYERVQELME
jgi:hypothetical protein